MTPAERIEQGIDNWWSRPEDFPTRAEFILDALCPRGERVVLDRTGDTDRLVRQTPTVSMGGRYPVWVDSPEGSE